MIHFQNCFTIPRSCLTREIATRRILKSWIYIFARFDVALCSCFWRKSDTFDGNQIRSVSNKTSYRKGDIVETCWHKRFVSTLIFFLQVVVFDGNVSKTRIRQKNKLQKLRTNDIIIFKWRVQGTSLAVPMHVQWHCFRTIESTVQIWCISCIVSLLLSWLVPTLLISPSCNVGHAKEGSFGRCVSSKSFL